MLQYKGFTLDKFQEESIAAIDKGHSVVVSAATGTGKTLIADYIVEQAIKEGFRVIYTAPIKALSNQKYKDFHKEYGDHIGLLTGDISINPDAQITIMTTEIYRNMLVDKENLHDLKYVIFDEIHFINDRERGTVWEESIIFSPPHVRFLCLSATIPNYRQFADWIQSIQHHTVDTVYYDKRAVPLEHFLFDPQKGIVTPEVEKKELELDKYPVYEKYGRRKRPDRRLVMGDHRDLIRELQAKDWLPCIFFVFSRIGTFEMAEELHRKFTFTTPKEQDLIIRYFNAHIKPEIKHMDSVRKLKRYLVKGIGVHNAGILPNLKDIVEYLFAEGLIKVLYATETFAVGINMPARTVCFKALEKFDGINFRYLNTKEYFQLAGRAGRRGIDPIGHAITLVNRQRIDIKEVIRILDKDIEPIISQFTLSYNTVLNLIKNYDDSTRKTILQSNFGYFVKKQSAQQSRITTSFANYVRRLTQLGFINNNSLTWKGKFGTYIYTKEIPISELIVEGVANELTDKELALVLTTLMYEPKPSDHFVTKRTNIGPIIDKLSSNKEITRGVNYKEMKRLANLVYTWYDGRSFDDAMDTCSLAEGDIIRLFRQVLDIISQIKHALITIKQNEQLVDRLDNIAKSIDRDLVAVDL